MLLPNEIGSIGAYQKRPAFSIRQPKHIISFIAGIFSSALLGLTITALGPSTPFLFAMILPLAAAILLRYIKENKRKVSL
jgi:predicted MFS family arabinose efflux permease